HPLHRLVPRLPDARGHPLPLLQADPPPARGRPGARPRHLPAFRLPQQRGSPLVHGAVRPSRAPLSFAPVPNGHDLPLAFPHARARPSGSPRTRGRERPAPLRRLLLVRGGLTGRAPLVQETPNPSASTRLPGRRGRESPARGSPSRRSRAAGSLRSGSPARGT